MLLFNLKVAFRNIRKNIVFSSVNIIGLAISMACCLIISLYVWDEWQQDTFHNNIDHIYRITEKQNQAGTLYNVAVTPGPLAPALQKDFPEIANTVRFGNWSGSLKNGKQVHDQASIQLTDNSIFKVFNFPLVKGNPNTALNGTDGIVITEKIAEQYFGADWRSKPDIIGQVFSLNNQDNFKVTGIAKNVPENSSIRFDILLPLAYLFKTDEWSYKWNSNNYHTYIQLKPGANVPALEAKLAKRLDAYNNDTADLLMLQPLKAQYLYSEFDFKTDWGKRNNIKYIRIFLGVGLLLLIIACVNFINLSTARSLKRSVEVGVRKVTGASRKQLVFQFLIESLSLAFIAGIVAILLIALFKPLVKNFTGADIDTGLSQSMLVPFFVGFIVIVGLLAGSYPAFVLSAFNPSRVLKTSETVRAGKFFRQTLVVGQFAISVTLIICVCFMYRQLTFMRNKDLGFDKEQVLRVGLGGKLMEKAALYKRDLDKIAGVKATSLATLSLANDENTSYVDWDGMQKDDKFLITQANVDPDFIPAMGMKLLSGSNFSPQMSNDTANFIINEASAQRMGYNTTSAVGKKVTFWGAKGSIIGVVKNFNYKPLSANIEPFIFRYQPKDRYFGVFIKVAPGKASAVIQQAGKLFADYEPDGTFQYAFLNESINRLYKNDQRVASFILFFAGLTIFVGCLGLFGLTVFAAEQRIKEIGIRKVLGAGLASIVALLSKDFLRLIVIAIAVAVPVSRYITYKWLENYTYRITVEWWVFGIVGFVVIAVALFTISFQAIKTATMNPVKSLRSE